MALGWTTLLTISLTEPIVGRNKHLTLYHWSGKPSSLVGPGRLVFAVVWLGTFLLLVSAETPGRRRAAVWGGILAVSPWVLAHVAERMVGLPYWVRLPPVGLAFALLLLLVLLWRPSFQPRFEKAVDLGSRALMLLAFMGAFCLIDILYLWWSAPSLDAAAPLRQPRIQAVHGPGPDRVIWIVFDELSYQQVYARRYPGLHLPAFDALAADATVFTQVVPAGSETQMVLPSLMTGEPVSDIRSTASGQLLTQARDGDRWQRFVQRDTVFQDALQAGYSTGVAGWYNPYCRLLPAVLDRCYWTVGGLTDTGADVYHSFGANLWSALGTLVGPRAGSALLGRFRHVPTDADVETEDHTRDYELLSTEAGKDLQDRSLRFVLLHMPIPHPWGIYDRRTGQIGGTALTSYLDNLALADRCMAEMRAILEDTGQWDGTAIVLMGDHGWRIDTRWRHLKPWYPEEEIASRGGVFDARPAYVVKLAGQQRGMTIGAPFAAVGTRQLLDALMRGQVRTPKELADWVQAQSGPCSPGSSLPCGQVRRVQMAK